MRVLIVDDDAAARTLMASLLRAEGLQVDVCKGAREALELLQTQLHDVLVTDYSMVGMDGVELARLARERSTRPRLPCVIVSGLPKPLNAPSNLQWVPKPVDLGDLLGAILAA